ncbi:MAG: hypothetical protein K5662_07635 [Lachnospiraceae bacterium]|nr:hypothetical protein [Lachnospiraceae bacterium]
MNETNEQLHNKIEDLERGLLIEKMISQTLFEIIMLEYSSLSIKDILDEIKINKVAIYGMGRIGKALYEMFIRNQISVIYCVDMNKNIELETTEIIHDIKKMTNNVDAVIITPEIHFESIKKNIESIVDCPIIMARELIENILLLPQPI